MLPKEAATKGKRIMTVRSTFALTVLAALGLAAAHPAAAQTQVFDLPLNSDLINTGGADNLWIGNQFTDSATEAVTYLGFFDNGSLLGTHSIYNISNKELYNKYDKVRLDDITSGTTVSVAIADISAITSTGVDASGTGFQLGSYYYVPATGPGIITAGGTYAIGIHQTDAFSNINNTGFVSDATPTNPDTNIAFNFVTSRPRASVVSGGGIGSTPSYGTANEVYLDGASFIVAAPEPAQTAALGLFGLGLGALVLKARKRKASGMAV